MPLRTLELSTEQQNIRTVALTELVMLPQWRVFEGWLLEERGSLYYEMEHQKLSGDDIRERLGGTRALASVLTLRLKIIEQHEKRMKDQAAADVPAPHFPTSPDDFKHEFPDIDEHGEPVLV